MQRIMTSEQRSQRRRGRARADAHLETEPRRGRRPRAPSLALALALVVALIVASALLGAGPAGAQEAAVVARPQLWEVAGAGWRQGAGELPLQEGRLTLPTGASDGTFVASVPAARPFDRLLLSLNPDPFPAGARVKARVRLRWPDGRWSGWLPLGVYGRGEGLPRSEPDPGEAGVQVDVDVVRSARPAAGAEVRLELQAGPAGAAPRLRRLAVSLWRSDAEPSRREEREPSPAAWGREVEAPSRSQQALAPELASRTCSPTSLAMALAHHGVDRTTEAVAAGVYDHGAKIYGNWSFNVAYAAEAGLETTACRLAGLADLEAEVAAGRPVVLSHRFGAGELTGSPVRATEGHLLLVVGFTADGDVVVHDPAADPARNQPIRRVYRRDQLARAWLERADGVVYLLRRP